VSTSLRSNVSPDKAPRKDREADPNAPAAEYARAILYARVSTKEQAGERHLSLGTQRDHYERWCKQYRAIPGKVYVDAVSGRKDSRAQYQKMLADLAAGEADVVVVQFLDRFGRRTPEIVTRFYALKAVGIRVVATDEPEVAQNDLLMMVKAWQAGEESQKIGKRVLPNMENAVNKGRWPSRAPFGYELVQDPRSPDLGRLRVNPAQAPLVVQIFERYATGKIGCHAIARSLNAAGVRIGDHVFCAQTVQKILKNPAYAGELVWNGMEVPGACPAIVAPELWEKVQRTLARRSIGWTRRSDRPAFPLEGLVWCACGSKRHNHQTSWVPTDGSESPRYYRCTASARAKTSCKTVKAAALETWVLDVVSGWEIPAEAIAIAFEERHAEAREQQRKVAAERKRLEATVDLHQKRLSTTYDLLADGVISIAAYTAKAEEYKGAIATATAELAGLGDGDLGADAALDRWYANLLQFRSLLPLLRQEPERLALELAELVDRVVVSEDGARWEVWPMQELGDLLHAAFTSNHGQGPTLRVVAGGRESVLDRIVSNGQP